MPSQLETLESRAEQKAQRRTRKRKPKMKVSGKSVFRLRKIITQKKPRRA